MSALDVIALFCVWQGAQLTLLLPRTRGVWAFLARQSDATLAITGLVLMGLALSIVALAR